MNMSCIDIGMMNVSARWRLAGSDLVNLVDTWAVCSLHCGHGFTEVMPGQSVPIRRR